MSPTSGNFYSEQLTKEAVEGTVGIKIGQVKRNVKYVDKHVRLVKKEMVLQGMTDRVVEIGGCHGMEMDVEESKVMRISGQTILNTSNDRL